MNERIDETETLAQSAQPKLYDILIIGAGLSGIFAAYEIAKQRPDLKIALLEQGRAVKDRVCPIVSGKVKQCISCPICAIMRGFGGAGAFSDGKFNFTTEFGGWLTDYLPEEEVLSLIDEVDKLNQEMGAKKEFHSTYSEAANEIRRKALGVDMHLLNACCKHLGTDQNREILLRMNQWLAEHIDLICECEVFEIQARYKGQKVVLDHEPKNEAWEDLKERLGESDAQQEQLPHNNCARHQDFPEGRPQVDAYHLFTSRGEFVSSKLIAAPGRAGAEWFSGQCRNLGLKLLNNQVDIGVRVELPALVFKEITDAVYEAKLKYQTKCYRDIVRTFCMNPYGYVVAENTDGIITVNGHSYEDPALASENTNFALLVSNRFTEPFNEPYKYGKAIASLSNMLGGGVLVQRLGDLLDGRRSTFHRMQKSFVKPTLDATPGDLSLVLPRRQLEDIMEMLMVLDKIAPGTANSDTLLYGVEVKFYSARLELSKNFETHLPGFYAIGDGAGITRGLSQAAASGLHAARALLKRMN